METFLSLGVYVRANALMLTYLPKYQYTVCRAGFEIRLMDPAK